MKSPPAAACAHLPRCTPRHLLLLAPTRRLRSFVPILLVLLLRPRKRQYEFLATDERAWMPLVRNSRRRRSTLRRGTTFVQAHRLCQKKNLLVLLSPLLLEDLDMAVAVDVELNHSWLKKPCWHGV